MLTPEASKQLSKSRPNEVVIAGIESHICVTQTALGEPLMPSDADITADGIDLLNEGYKVTVLADAVSSFSLEEHEAALLRLRQSGVRVMSFESWLFGTVKTASHPKYVISKHVARKKAKQSCCRFKQVSGIVKSCRLARSSTVKALL